MIRPLNMVALTITERCLAAQLEGHLGRAKAISAAVLANMTGLSAREIGATIKRLVEKHGVLIGSATDTPPGYYLVSTAEELEAVQEQLWGRALSCLVRISRLKRTGVEEIFAQLPLHLQASDEESSDDA